MGICFVQCRAVAQSWEGSGRWDGAALDLPARIQDPDRDVKATLFKCFEWFKSGFEVF